MLRDHRILNPALLHALASVGHTDIVVVADAGLPVDPAVQLIDLSLVPGVPSFTDVTQAVLASLQVEEAIVAIQSTTSPVADILPRILVDIPLRTVDHTELKTIARTARVVIRTGECTPYANVALVAGVNF